MTTMTRDALVAIRDAVIGREPTPYDYRGEPWDQSLQKLPQTCLLWQRFIEYDTARIAFDEADVRRQRWSTEGERLGRQLEATDPDADLGAAEFSHGYMRTRQLQYALDRQREQMRELKAKRDRAHDGWAQVWSAYKGLLETMRQVRLQPRQMAVAGMASPWSDKLAELEIERRQFEASEG